MKYVIYTDGACSGNPGNGGWGAIIISDKKEKIISGSVNHTTNNRMELTAVIEALKFVDGEVKIFTDSKYVKDGIEEWISKWKVNGWITANKKNVKNKDLWIILDKLVQSSSKKIIWKWVKGHAKDTLNNRVDEIARRAIKI